MKWVRLVLTVILVVGSASITAAECAWVLWSKTMGSRSPSTTWDIEHSFPDHQRCLTGREQKWAESVGFWAQMVGKPGIEFSQVKDDSSEKSLTLYKWQAGKIEYWLTTRYLCLSDTIDPREKK